MQLWITPQQAAERLPHKSPKTIYEQIRTGIFPFVYRRAGRAILISARDLGLVVDDQAEKKEAQNQEETLASAA